MVGPASRRVVPAKTSPAPATPGPIRPASSIGYSTASTVPVPPPYGRAPLKNRLNLERNSGRAQVCAPFVVETRHRFGWNPTAASLSARVLVVRLGGPERAVQTLHVEGVEELVRTLVAA